MASDTSMTEQLAQLRRAGKLQTDLTRAVTKVSESREVVRRLVPDPEHVLRDLDEVIGQIQAKARQVARSMAGEEPASTTVDVRENDVAHAER